MLRRARIGLTVAVAGLAAALLAIVLVGQGAKAPPTRAQRADAHFVGPLEPPGLRVPDFTLRDQHGRQVSMAQFRGRPTVITFLYTHCKDTCPLTATTIRGALNELPGGGRDIPVVAISVDPPGPGAPAGAHDNPAAARRFVAKERMRGRMRFLLGTRSQLRPVWRAFHIQPHEGEGDLDHTAYVLLADRRGFLRVGFPAQGLVPEQLSHDLRELTGRT